MKAQQATAQRSDVALQAEFERQLETVLRTGYPGLVGTTSEDFAQRVEPLAERLPELGGDGSETRIPFVIAVQDVAPERAMPLVELRGKPGFTSMERDDLARFAAIEGVDTPQGLAYLVADIDTGRDMLNVTPDDALETIVSRGRSPLTLAEGIALVTQFPEALKTQNAFSILGSRCGDRRVPALWVSKGQPRLGWCWAGNPHTWLGSASCGGRLMAHK